MASESHGGLNELALIVNKRPTNANLSRLAAESRERALSVALRITGNHADAHDAVQTAMIKALKSVESGNWREEASWTSFLFRAVANAAFDIAKAKKRYADFKEGQKQAGERPSKRDPEGGRKHLGLFDPGHEAEVADRLNTELLLAHANTIPEIFRLPFLLYHADNLEYEEIARAPDIPNGTVKSRINRARTLMRKSIERNTPALPWKQSGTTRLQRSQQVESQADRHFLTTPLEEIVRQMKKARQTDEQ